MTGASISFTLWGFCLLILFWLYPVWAILRQTIGVPIFIPNLIALIKADVMGVFRCLLHLLLVYFA